MRSQLLLSLTCSWTSLCEEQHVRFTPAIKVVVSEEVGFSPLEHRSTALRIGQGTTVRQG